MEEVVITYAEQAILDRLSFYFLYVWKYHWLLRREDANSD
jgi:hypothetical protein